MSKPETILQISPDDLMEREGWNVRFADDPDNVRHVAQLAESIYHVGVLEPLTVYKTQTSEASQGETVTALKDVYVVVNGHCRLAAVRQAIARGAPIKSVPVRVADKRASEADHSFGMIARNSGKPLTQLELGVVMKRLVGLGWTEADLGQKTGYSVQHVRNCLTLASAPAEIAKMVETGQVSASLATQAIAAEGGEQATETLKAAVEVAEREAKPAKKGKPAAPVKATLKHVAKAKGVHKSQAAKKKTNKQPEPSSMVKDEKLAAVLFDMKPEHALQTFDTYGKRRERVWKAIMERLDAATPRPESNGRDPDLTTLGLMFDRAADAVSDDEPTITTIVMSTDDWRTVCAILRIKELAEDDQRMHAPA